MKKFMYTPNKRKWISLACLFVAVLFWGAAYPALDYVIQLNEMSQSMMNLLRFGFGALILLPFSIAEFKKMTKRDWCVSAISGLFLFLAFLFLTTSIADGTPGLAAMLLNVGVFIIPILCIFIYKKKPKSYVWISIVIIFIGVTLIAFKDGFETPSFTLTLSIIFGLISSVFFSFQIMALDFYKSTQANIANTFVQMLTVFVLFAIWILITNPHSFVSISGTKSLFPIACIGIFASGISYLLVKIASVNLTVQTNNIILSLESFFASIISVVFGYDNLTFIFVIACSIILFAVFYYVIKSGKDELKENDNSNQDNQTDKTS